MAKQSVLIVDDELLSLMALQAMLEISGYKVFTFEKAQGALDAVERVRPDIILTDIMMPELDGFELCRLLRQNPASQDIPVVLLTSLNDSLSMMKGFRMGAAGYLLKPFENEAVLERVAQVLRMKAQQQPQNLFDEHDDIEEMTLFKFLGLCEQDRISGTIHLIKPGDKGIIRLQDGEITDVEFESPITDVQIRRVLQWRWKDGHFSVEEDGDAHENGADNGSELQELAGMLEPEEKPEPAPAREENSFSEETRIQLRDVLRSIRDELEDAEIIALAGQDGKIVASDVADGTSVPNLEAMIAAFVELSMNACQTVEQGEFTEGLMEGDEGIITLYHTGMNVVLGVVIRMSESNLGMINIVCRTAAKTINDILAAEV